MFCSFVCLGAFGVVCVCACVVAREFDCLTVCVLAGLLVFLLDWFLACLFACLFV